MTTRFTVKNKDFLKDLTAKFITQFGTDAVRRGAWDGVTIIGKRIQANDQVRTSNLFRSITATKKKKTSNKAQENIIVNPDASPLRSFNRKTKQTIRNPVQPIKYANAVEAQKSFFLVSYPAVAAAFFKRTIVAINAFIRTLK